MSQEETQATEGAKLEDTAATAEVEQPQAEEPKEQAEPTEPTTDWKANSRKWEDRAKSNKEQLDAALKEIEELKASQATNTTEQLEQANAKIAELQLKSRFPKRRAFPLSCYKVQTRTQSPQAQTRSLLTLNRSPNQPPHIR